MEIARDAQAPKSRGLLLIVLAALMWGTVGVTSRAIYGMAETNALSIGFFRLVFSVPALLAACWYVLGQRTLQIARQDLLPMALIGGAMALYQVCYFAAIARVGVSIAVLVTLCSAPVMVALLSAAMFGERLTGRLLLALGCALAGTLLLVGMQQGDDATAQQNTLVGVLEALGAGLGYSVITLSSRGLAQRYHPLQPITVGFAVGALALLPFALAVGLTLNYPVAGWGLLLHLGLVPTALAYVLFLAGMRSTSATVATIVTLLEPLTSTLLAALLFGERLGAWGLVGGALLLGAIVLLYQGGKGDG